MKKTLLHLALLMIMPAATFAQWQTISSPTAGNLEGLYFINNTTGFISTGYGNMYKTTNAGTTWSTVGNYGARDIWFFDANVGYATSGAGAPGGTMKKTVNGGTTWTAITPPNSSAYWGACPTSATTAYFINTEDKVIKTTNGGTTVSSYSLNIPNGNQTVATDIFFPEANTGYICTDGGHIIKTTNAGATWTYLQTGVSSSLRMLYFFNASVGFAGGSKILKTTNGGSTWTELTLPGSISTHGIRFFDMNNGLAVGLLGKIYRTADGGSTWVEEASGTTQHLRNVFYLDANTAIVIGDGGTILKNSNLLSSATPVKTTAITLTPNPVSDVSTLNIEAFEDHTNLTLEIYDLKGQLLLQENIKSAQHPVMKNNLQAGTYFLAVKEGNKSVKSIQFLVE